MKAVALLLNAVLVVTVIGLAMDFSSPMSDKDVALMAIFLAAPIASSIALIRGRVVGQPLGLLRLYLLRRRLEEERKIDALKIRDE